MNADSASTIAHIEGVLGPRATAFVEEAAKENVNTIVLYDAGCLRGLSAHVSTNTAKVSPEMALVVGASQLFALEDSIPKAAAIELILDLIETIVEKEGQ